MLLITYLCFSQNVSVLNGEALCRGKGVLRVLRKSGGYLGGERDIPLATRTLDISERINV